jgi:hypothetical protein
MHQSIFSYNVTRRYPFRWFTPVVIVGGIIVIVLVSLVNVPNNGYELVQISSNDPNATVNTQTWFGSWSPLIVSKSRSTCAESSLPLDSKVYSNSSGLPWTVTNVVRDGGDDRNNHLPLLIYRNNPLQNCTVDSVRINVQGRFERNTGHSATSWVGLDIKAYARCALEIETAPNPYKPTFVDLVGTYNLVGSYETPDGASSTFLARNRTTMGSLYWGESLLKLYWMVVARSYYEAARDKNTTIEHQSRDYRATLHFRRRSSARIMTAEEAMSPDFFRVACNTPDNFCGNDSVPVLSQGGGSWRPFPSIWNRTDILARAMYYTAMVDLGRTDRTNMLTDPKLLEFLTANVTNEARAWQKLQDDDRAGTLDAVVHLGLDRNLANTSFSASDASKWGLGVAPAVLATTYTCQVPQAKPAGVFFLSVLIADLVLLQAIWLVFKLVVDGFFVRTEMLVCRGCNQEVTTGLQDVKMTTWGGLSQVEGNHVHAPDDTHLGTRGLDNVPLVGNMQKTHYERIDEVESDRSTGFERSRQGSDDHFRSVAH